MNTISVVNLGRTDYAWCWDVQRRVAAQHASCGMRDVLLLTEHDHVYTIGTSGNSNHLLAGEEELHHKGISVYYSDRGGDITYHGPGQLVGYPILDLRNYYFDLHRYLRDVEEVIIRVLSTFGITGERIPGYTGVWVGQDKICAIGIKTIRWITMHGFALNVNTDLSLFGRIIPCGIFEKGVTSLRELLQTTIDLEDVERRVAKEFGVVFGRDMQEVQSGRFVSQVLHSDVPGMPSTGAVASHIESM